MALIEQQAAIDAIHCDIVITGRQNAETVCKAIEQFVENIKAIPPAQPKQTDCEYCHEDSEGYVKPLEKNCHAYIGFGMNGWTIELKANGWRGEAKIKYCPICGRRLTDGTD